MHKTLSRAIMSGLVASGLTSATSSVSLSNFTPRIENLPSQCQGVYVTPIENCQASDFTTTGSTCSSACVSGLVKISQAVATQCASVDVPETSIIGVFLLGQGIQALCPGVSVTTLSSSSSTQQQTSTPAPAPSTTAAAPASSSPAVDTDPNVPSPTTLVSTPSPSAAPPTVIAPAPPPPAAVSSSPAAPSETATQKSNAESGGGSPFDVVATGISSQLYRNDALLAVMAGVFVLVCTSM